ncbi:MAG: hypothetical protein AVDCRST_MAG22-694 [uncultured Rubrobacteraceae bacterium]|uniref:Thiamine-binding protein domain-containing protein n=1 Tax=uncultured Rubrobacteraceae bacterium TaxID=349277 RepID=A0A6J4NNN4_9ACTN|nr:MAG: hypothetical protein AVDCRST_MAG22-694 [uncultured Rubrobacteraceae bacterium]
MPAFERAELTAELKVLPSGGDESRAQVEAAKAAAGETGLAREAGPETMVLAGERREVLEAVTRVLEAALDAGAGGAELKIEAQGDAPRFGEQG